MCSCDEPSEDIVVRLDDRLKSAIAFEGTVISVVTRGEEASVFMAVSLAWTAVLDEKVEVITETDDASCGLASFFSVGKECLVYASIRDGKLFTDSCSGTAAIDDPTAILEVAELERRATLS